MAGDERRVVAAFCDHLRADGWTVTTEVRHCDVLAERDGARVYAEAKGTTNEPGLDVDTLYGQLLRRMPDEDDPAARFAVVVPERIAWAAQRVPPRVRELLRIDLYTVGSDRTIRRAESGQ